MNAAIGILNCFALVVALFWFYENTQYRQDVLERKDAAKLAATKSTRPIATSDPNVPNLMKNRLNQPYETVQQQFDFYRNLKSPNYSNLKAADTAKLIKTLNDNKKLKKFCKDRVGFMKELKTRHSATKTRLAWFEEWYPKLHAAHKKLVENGGPPGHDIEAFQNYAKEAKKAFGLLKRQQEATKYASRMRLIASADDKNEAIAARKVAMDAQRCLADAEYEIERLQDAQKTWQIKERSLETELKKLALEKHLLETQPFHRGSHISGSPLINLPSMTESFEPIHKEDCTKGSRSNSPVVSSPGGYDSPTGGIRTGSWPDPMSQISWSDEESDLSLVEGEPGSRVEYSFF